MSRIQHLQPQHVIAAAVAACCVALALAGGGFEPTAFAAAGLVVWILVLLALATGFAPRAEPPTTAVLAGLAFAGLTALMALSLIWASDVGNGFEDVVRALGYLGAFVAVVLASTRGQARPWLAGLAIGLVAVGAIALLARFEPDPFGNPDADLQRTLPAVFGRLTYPVGYWNGLAAAMAASILLLSWFSATSSARRVRCAAVAAMPPMVLALWMTDSRGGIVAAALALGILLAIGPHRSRLVANLALAAAAGAILVAFAEARDALLNDPGGDLASGQGHEMLAITIGLVAATLGLRRLLDGPIQELAFPRRAGTVAAAAAGIAVLAVIVVADPVQQWDEFKAPPTGEELANGEVGLLRGGGSGRYQFWETAVDAFASAPIGGVGTAGYTPYWFEHRAVPIPATRAHSVVFETMAELGAAGLILLIAFFGCAALAGAARLRAANRVADTCPALALLVIGFAAAAVDWTWDLPAVFGVTIVAAALLTGPATLAGPDGGPPATRWQVRSRRRFAGGIVVLLVAWVSICGSALLLLSANSLDSSRDAAADGDIEAALDGANDAIDLQPWAAEPRTQLALVYEQAGELDRAREAMAEAIERSPDDYRLRLLASRMAAEDDDPAAARQALLAAHALNPRDPDIFEQVAATSS